MDSRNPVSKFRQADDEQWLAAREAFEGLPENRITVEREPRRWHAAVLPLRNQLLEAAHRLEKAKRAVERAQRRVPKARGSTSDALSPEWHWLLGRGHLLLPGHRAVPLRVSAGTYERALAIVNALAFAADGRGFEVGMDKEQTRLLFTGHGGRVELRIAERLAQHYRVEKRWASDHSQQIRALTPTGQLRVYVCAQSSGGEATLGDMPGSLLESLLNDVFVRIYRQVVKCREWERYRADQDRRFEAARVAREADEARRTAEAARHDEERRRRLALVVEARNWQRAETIRAYVDHLARIAETGSTANAEWIEWKAWALEVAETLDPTGQRLRER